MADKVLILNGPNLNLLGKRQPEIYGTITLAEIDEMCKLHGTQRGLAVECRQSNHEGEIIDWIHEARELKAGIILNAGAYSHSSIAIMDAISSAERPVIEVHLSNIHKRESYRHTSYVSKVAVGMICGLGAQGYILAIEAISRILEDEKKRLTGPSSQKLIANP
ncbi:type II 3-dehydroquinate dehydratase [Flexibacterium corallicola]|uniref:type II 3-dehydroquinate dehydratase n=1 Tax=Flexibacterium corallicola TaxID=3037259 RepID=UPI00286F8DF9|nr:type II 3-dehydroquinate dehydratase [Pseudovibrio sp. M1P-2-3]